MNDSAERLTLEHYPYASRRLPLVATRGVVATSKPLAAQAGLQMMLKGGSTRRSPPRSR
jgi:gamma-glutamyltranspeptidase / glutathione hydrolase